MRLSPSASMSLPINTTSYLDQFMIISFLRYGPLSLFINPSSLVWYNDQTHLACHNRSRQLSLWPTSRKLPYNLFQGSHPPPQQLQSGLFLTGDTIVHVFFVIFPRVC